MPAQAAIACDAFPQRATANNGALSCSLRNRGVDTLTSIRTTTVHFSTGKPTRIRAAPTAQETRDDTMIECSTSPVMLPRPKLPSLPRSSTLTPLAQLPEIPKPDPRTRGLVAMTEPIRCSDNPVLSLIPWPHDRPRT